MSIDTLKLFAADQLQLVSYKLYESLVGFPLAKQYKDRHEQIKKKCRHLNLDNYDELSPSNRIPIEIFQKCGHTELLTNTAEIIARSVKAKLARMENPWSQESKGSNSYSFIDGRLLLHFPELANLFENELSTFLRQIFQTNFSVYYGLMYKTMPSTAACGSQLWHTDSGPGCCINVMFYIDPVSEDAGPIQVISLADSMRIEREFRKMLRKQHGRIDGAKRRMLRNDFVDLYLAKNSVKSKTYKSLRPGLIIPFLNNTFHRGNIVIGDTARRAVVFHCYPSSKKLSADSLLRADISKRQPFPRVEQLQ